MGRIENYDNDSGISSLDRLFGTSYEGMLDGRPVYKTKNYLMGEVISKISSEVASAGDRWSSISYKFTPQMIYDLGDADSGVLDLYSVSEDTFTKYWTLVPAVSGKGIVVSNIVVYGKANTTNFNVNYTTGIAMGSGASLFIDFQTSSMLNITSSYIYRPNVLSVSGNTIIKFNIGSPLLLSVTNSTLMTQGDAEFGIFIEYKYFDFNLDFNG